MAFDEVAARAAVETFRAALEAIMAESPEAHEAILKAAGAMKAGLGDTGYKRMGKVLVGLV